MLLGWENEEETESDLVQARLSNFRITMPVTGVKAQAFVRVLFYRQPHVIELVNDIIVCKDL